jgi:hypothetical protein
MEGNNEEKKDGRPQISRPKKTVGLLKKEKEQLYEAYNLLHSLAQVMMTPALRSIHVIMPIFPVGVQETI